MAALSKPTNGGLDYPTRIGALFDAFNKGNYQFPATQVASADPNTLDDYEEGTWTPSLGGTATYTTQSGVYTKIGRMIHVQCSLTVNSIGTGSTGAISGLPFTASASTRAGHVGFFSGAASNFVFASIFLSGGASTLSVSTLAAAGTSMSAPGVFFANSTQILCGAIYYN